MNAKRLGAVLVLLLLLLAGLAWNLAGQGKTKPERIAPTTGPAEQLPEPVARQEPVPVPAPVANETTGASRKRSAVINLALSGPSPRTFYKQMGLVFERFGLESLAKAGRSYSDLRSTLDQEVEAGGDGQWKVTIDCDERTLFRLQVWYPSAGSSSIRSLWTVAGPGEPIQCPVELREIDRDREIQSDEPERKLAELLERELGGQAKFGLVRLGLVGLDVGQWSVEVRKDDEVLDVFDVREEWSNTRLLVVPAGSQRLVVSHRTHRRKYDVDVPGGGWVVMTQLPAPAGAGYLGGVVLDMAGRPLPRASVMLKTEGGRWGGDARIDTDPSGRFHFAGLDEDLKAPTVTVHHGEYRFDPAIPVTMGASTHEVRARGRGALFRLRVRSLSGQFTPGHAPFVKAVTGDDRRLEPRCGQWVDESGVFEASFDFESESCPLGTRLRFTIGFEKSEREVDSDEVTLVHGEELEIAVRAD